MDIQTDLLKRADGFEWLSVVIIPNRRLRRNTDIDLGLFDRQTNGEAGCVHVEIKGKDSQVHAVTIQASSLYDGAAQSIKRWAKLWWFDSSTVLTVKSEDEQWDVRQDAVRRWQGKERGL